MHRSGTSAFTRALNLLGVDLPGNLMLPAPDNVRGFWESKDLAAIHDELLAAAGTSWDAWTRVEPDWFESHACGRFRARLLVLLAADFGASRLFVLKDPRMCRLFPLWHGVLREFDSVVRVVIPLRNPVEVVSSLGDRDGFSPAKSYLLWLRHVLDAEHDTRGVRRCIIRFDELLREPERVLRTIGRRLAVRWRRPLATVRGEIDDFVSVAERHWAVDGRSLDMRQGVAVWVGRTYNALATIAGDGESAQARADLEAISSEIDRATTTLWPIVAEHSTTARDRTAEVEALRTTLSAQAGEVSALQEALAAVRSALAERVADADQLRGGLTAARAALGRTRGRPRPPPGGVDGGTWSLGRAGRRGRGALQRAGRCTGGLGRAGR